MITFTVPAAYRLQLEAAIANAINEVGLSLQARAASDPGAVGTVTVVIDETPTPTAVVTRDGIVLDRPVPPLDLPLPVRRRILRAS